MFIQNKINFNFKHIVLFSIFFEIIFFLRTGLVYSYPNDQLWHHFFLYIKEFSLDLDLMSFANSEQRSLWFFFMGNLSKIFDPLQLYYIFIITQNFIFFLICFLIFDHFLIKKTLLNYILFGFVISSNYILFSGSLASFHEISYTYRSTGYVLNLLAIYFVLKNKPYYSIIIAFAGSLMHLPISVPFYIFFITFIFLRKYNFKITTFFLISIILLVIFNLSHVSFIKDEEYLDLAKKLMYLRQSYLYIENWNTDYTLRYFLFYICFFTSIIFTRSVLKKFLIILFLMHLSYLVCVYLTYELPTFSVFKLGRELPFIFLVFLTMMINFTDNNPFNNLLIFISLFSLILFSSLSIFLIIFLIQTILNKNKINYTFSKLYSK